MYTKEDAIVDTFVTIMAILLLIVTLYPFLNILAISFNDVTDTTYGLVGIWPRQFTINNYLLVLRDPIIYIALLNSVLRTVIGTIFSLCGCLMSAYLIYRKDFVLRKPFIVILIITMYVSGGMIPEFIVMKELGFIGTFSVYIVPNFVFAFNVFLIVNYMNKLPKDLVESAKIDGAGDFKILVKILIPLSMPIIATVALFCAVGQWSAWFDVMLYNSEFKNLSTLQFELQRKMQSAASVIGGGNIGHGEGSNNITPEAIQATMTIIATVPILIVYPFLQKYFVKGMTLGSVKE